jgi:hypothetical protein
MCEWKSQPLARLRADIGEAVAALNTAVVGLDAVEKGHEKPQALDVSWAPENKQAAARKARKFIIDAVLIRVFEALYEHTLLIARLPRLSAAKKNWDGNTSHATQIWDIYEALLGKTYLVSAAVLLCHWRNRIVHFNSNAKLQAFQKRLLQENELDIAKSYKGLSVDRLLGHFEEKRPTLKDVSVLIAMTLNLAREADQKLSSDLTKEDFDAWLDYFDLKDAIAKVERETKSEKQAAAIGRLFQARAPMLLDGFRQYYSSTLAI